MCKETKKEGKSTGQWQKRRKNVKLSHLCIVDSFIKKMFSTEILSIKIKWCNQVKTTL